MVKLRGRGLVLAFGIFRVFHGKKQAGTALQLLQLS